MFAITNLFFCGDAEEGSQGLTHVEWVLFTELHSQPYEYFLIAYYNLMLYVTAPTDLTLHRSALKCDARESILTFNLGAILNHSQGKFSFFQNLIIASVDSDLWTSK